MQNIKIVLTTRHR